jgi:hypothetical protein
MADDEWISHEAIVTKMTHYDCERLHFGLAPLRSSFGLVQLRPYFGSARLLSALDKRRIRLRGQRAEDPNGEPIEIAYEDLEGLIFEPPGRLVRPGSANTPATVVYINIRFSASDADSFLEEVRAGQERDCLRRATFYSNQWRWRVEPALAWIAYRRIELLILSYDELQIRILVASRGSGNADGLVSKNPAGELLNALKAGKLEAIDANHNKLPPEFWDERSSDPRTWPKVRFRRDDIRNSWPSVTNLRAVLEKGIEDKGAMLTQGEAWKIARDARAIEKRDEVLALLKSLGGSDKPGPKGPRKKRAAPSA